MMFSSGHVINHSTLFYDEGKNSFYIFFMPSPFIIELMPFEAAIGLEILFSSIMPLVIRHQNSLLHYPMYTGQGSACRIVSFSTLRVDWHSFKVLTLLEYRESNFCFFIGVG